MVIDNTVVCPLTLCVLPSRSVIVNEDWVSSVNDLEDALLVCAAQVEDCIKRQNKGLK